MSTLEYGILSAGLVTTALWLASVLAHYVTDLLQLPFFK